MKLQKTKQTMIIASVASLALLLAMGTANAGNGNGKSNSPKDGGGASIGVSNVCTVVDTDAGADLVVVTTIIDKTTGKVKGGTPPEWGSDSKVQAQQKIDRGKVLTDLGDPIYFTPVVGTQTTPVQLCDADGNPLVDPLARALNASLTVDVMNSNNSPYDNSQCGDDPLTEGVDESKIKLALIDLVGLCAPPPPPLP